MSTPQRLQAIFHNFELLKRQLWKKHSHNDIPLTRAQMGLMIFIDENGPQTISQVAKHWNMSSSAVTQMVDTLVNLKYVARTQTKEDRRKLQVSLTKAGAYILTKAKKIRLKLLAELLAPLTNEELYALENMQEKILRHHNTSHDRK